MKKQITVITSLVLCLILVFAMQIPALAANANDGIAPQASDYISYTSANISSSNGTLTVTFDICATGKMTSVGALYIKIYTTTSTSAVKSFDSDTTPGLMAYNDYSHNGSVSYSGTVGKRYYATVTFRAADNTGSHMLTNRTGTITA